MVKVYESKTIFQFTWDQVVQGFWKRYPNPESKHVLSEDTLQRDIKDDKLFTKRLFTKTNRVPKWGEKFIGSPVVKVIEQSVVDPKEKVLITYTKNLGYTKVMSVVEKVVYRVSEENPNWTIAERTALIDSQVIGFGRAIQAFGTERFKKNCAKMVNGFNHVLMNMFPPQSAHVTSTNNITHAPLTNADKLRGAAKKASELAKAKAGKLYVKCEPSM